MAPRSLAGSCLLLAVLAPLPPSGFGGAGRALAVPSVIETISSAHTNTDAAMRVRRTHPTDIVEPPLSSRSEVSDRARWLSRVQLLSVDDRSGLYHFEGGAGY